MIEIDQVIKEVAKRLDLDRDLVSTICRQPFLQTVEIMKDQMIIDRIILDENYNDPTTHNTISNEIIFFPE